MNIRCIKVLRKTFKSRTIVFFFLSKLQNLWVFSIIFSMRHANGGRVWILLLFLMNDSKLVLLMSNDQNSKYTKTGILLMSQSTE